MKRWLICRVCFLTLGFLSLAQVAQAQSGKVLVRLKDSPTVSAITVSDVSTALSLLRADQRVDQVEPDVERHISVEPDDPYFSAQADLEQTNDHDIDAAAAWTTTTGSRAVIVGVIDTGIDIDHPDLVDNIWTNPNEIADNGIDDDNNGYIDDVHGWDFVENDNDPNPTPTSARPDTTVVIHGTHVAGIIGATGNNATGVTGVNWTVSLMPLRVFDDEGNSSISEVLEAIAYAQANGAQILNMSYGGTSSSSFESDAITEAYEHNILSVAAAGNESTDLNTTPEYPACYHHVLGVGAVDDDDDLASFSNYGTDCVDVGAPGQRILSTYYFDGSSDFPETKQYGFLSGTSMATPVVSGVAALLVAAQTNSTPSELTDFITSTADDIDIAALGAGRINAASAVAATVIALNPTAPSITVYHGQSRRSIMSSATRTNDSRPYFTWATTTSSDITGYYLYFGRQKSDPITDGIFTTDQFYEPSAVHGNNKTYRVRIKALDSSGRTSDLSQFLYQIDTKVKRPTWQSNSLAWYKPSGEHVVGYVVYRSTHASTGFKKISSRLTTTSYTDTTAVTGKTYYYKVRSIDDLGNKSILSKAQQLTL